ncbi:uncharacterized protein si:dkey-7j14.6 isoform X1 [Pseudoliparis swirei]|uniref:uncharacterized protein si:dkey-7j14.6 isoform X1 n=1 Tax=Pseudoliparis swirei TaxID=2059687 RepID=UPI0024BE03D4|nr:uncharacterized protein si:dkey-7j14.6 isoform X1 [Pseudoliparis swirei]
MASTSITAVGGVVTVTQVIPQDSSPKRATPTFPASKMDDMTAAFLRGEPRGLGMVQVSVGLLCVLFSLTSLFSPTLVPHAPLSLAVILVVSGSIAVATAKQPSVGWSLCAPGPGLGSLVSSLVSALLGLGGVAYLCWLLAEGPASKLLCDSDAFRLSGPQETRCRQNLTILNVCVYGLQGVLLVLLVLQVCVTVTVSVFSVRALQRRDAYPAFKVEVGDDDVVLLDSQ